MDSEKQLKLILKNETFLIPYKFNNLTKTTMSIFTQLMENGHYHVQSNVSKAVLKSFINCWVHDQVPKITSEEFLEYLQLSEEFDYMKETINEYRDDQERNKEYIKEIPCLKQKIEEQNIQINQMKSQISTLMQYIKWLHIEKTKNLAEEEKGIQGIESANTIVNGCWNADGIYTATHRLKGNKIKTYTMEKKLIDDEKQKFQSIFSD